jgi:dipeptidase
MDTGLPDAMNTQPADQYDANSFWWQHELLHRKILQDFSNRKKMMEPERNTLEKNWMDKLAEFNQAGIQSRKTLTEDIFNRQIELMKKWSIEMQQVVPERRNTFYFEWEWRKNNREAKIPLQDK